jgi:hypothetical protein
MVYEKGEYLNRKWHFMENKTGYAACLKSAVVA